MKEILIMIWTKNDADMNPITLFFYRIAQSLMAPIFWFSIPKEARSEKPVEPPAVMPGAPVTILDGKTQIHPTATQLANDIAKSVGIPPEQLEPKKSPYPDDKSLTLMRTMCHDSGIFGVLLNSEGKQIAVTLEHSYMKDGENRPKVKTGSYVCKLGPHRLASMKHNFDTYEIENVPGHTDILFHRGNNENDSEGCVLLGEKLMKNDDGSYWINNSKVTFSKFMNHQAGVPEFNLEVKEALSYKVKEIVNTLA